MRRMFIALVLAVGLALPAAAQESEIETVIQSQIDAFLRDDFAAAFTYASPTIKRLFGDPGNFGRMVRRGYPMVWRPAEVEFLELEPMGGAMVQRVMIRDASGEIHILAYQMVRTDDGWQINGVRILEGSAFSA